MDNPIAVCLDRNPFKTVAELVEAVARVGFARVEWFETGAEEMWSGLGVAPQVRELVRRHGLTPQYHAPYEPPFDLGRDGDVARPPESVAVLLSMALDRAERVEASLVTAHLGSCPPGVDRGVALRNVIAGIRRTIPELERRRIRLALENHTKAIIASSMGDQPEDFDFILKELPSEWIGRTLDLGHAHINGHLEEFLSRPFDRVFNIHLHDNLGKADQHLPLGEGAIRWDTILPRIAHESYRGPLTFEFFASPAAYHRAMEIVRAAK